MDEKGKEYKIQDIDVDTIRALPKKNKLAVQSWIKPCPIYLLDLTTGLLSLLRVAVYEENIWNIWNMDIWHMEEFFNNRVVVYAGNEREIDVSIVREDGSIEQRKSLPRLNYDYTWTISQTNKHILRLCVDSAEVEVWDFQANLCLRFAVLDGSIQAFFVEDEIAVWQAMENKNDKDNLIFYAGRDGTFHRRLGTWTHGEPWVIVRAFQGLLFAVTNFCISACTRTGKVCQTWSLAKRALDVTFVDDKMFVLHHDSVSVIKMDVMCS